MSSLRLGDLAPDFSADSTQGPIRFHDRIDKGWAVLFSHPADLTPVCTTELGATARLKGEFDKRGVKVATLRVDALESHHRWIADIEQTQEVQLGLPIIADPEQKAAEQHYMIHPNASEKTTVRSLFIIGPDKKVKLMIVDPASTGRNFQEILRVTDSLQLTAKHQLATPADRKDGEEVIILPAVSDEEAHKRYPAGFRAVKPYLRYVDQPRD